MLIQFHDFIANELIDFAVIAALYEGQWLFCRHRERTTYELPGGHCEPDESPLQAACRELEEETGAIDYEICPICVYSVTNPSNKKANLRTTYGILCIAHIKILGPLPNLEIAEVLPLDPNILSPEQWTYPLIQPLLLTKVQHFLAQ